MCWNRWSLVSWSSKASLAAGLESISASNWSRSSHAMAAASFGPVPPSLRHAGYRLKPITSRGLRSPVGPLVQAGLGQPVGGVGWFRARPFSDDENAAASLVEPLYIECEQVRTFARQRGLLDPPAPLEVAPPVVESCYPSSDRPHLAFRQRSQIISFDIIM